MSGLWQLDPQLRTDLPAIGITVSFRKKGLVETGIVRGPGRLGHEEASSDAQRLTALVDAELHKAHLVVTV